jgi:membrane protein DedA with SNARE-associated domain
LSGIAGGRRRYPGLILSAAAAVVATADASANVVAPRLVTAAPLLLVFLSPRVRYLILVVARVDPLQFVIIATARQLVGDILFFLLGNRYGKRIFDVLPHRLPVTGPALDLAEKALRNIGPPLIALSPNNILSMVVGASGAPLGRFLIIDGLGTIVRGVVILLASSAYKRELTRVGDWIGVHSWILMPALLLLTALVWVLQWRRSRVPPPRVKDANDVT